MTPNLLGIHVLGGGYGESIVLTLPNGGVGVIDCFAPRLRGATSNERRASNPTLRFLRDTIQADRLAFLAFTHPHEDHGRGLSHLLQEYRNRIEQIWVFASFHDTVLAKYFEALMDGRRRLPMEELLQEEPGSFSREFLRTHDLISEQCDERNRNRARIRHFQGCLPAFQIANEPVWFIHLGPSHQLLHAYQEEVSDSTRQALGPDGKARKSWRPDQINHNRVSPVLVVEYGRTRVVLGGDMEAEGWSAVLEELAEPRRERVRLLCQLFKVSHHGSATGYTASLLERHLCGGGRSRERRFAVLTPFTRNQSPLPSTEGLDHLLTRVGTLFATNIAVAYHTSGRTQAGIALDDAIPPDWAADIQRDPRLQGALHPSLVQSRGGPVASVPIPGHWLSSIHDQPDRVRLIHPDSRQALVRQDLLTKAPETDCRISLYFNAAGREQKSLRYVGRLAGVVQ